MTSATTAGDSSPGSGASPTCGLSPALGARNERRKSPGSPNAPTSAHTRRPGGGSPLPLNADLRSSRARCLCRLRDSSPQRRGPGRGRSGSATAPRWPARPGGSRRPRPPARTRRAPRARGRRRAGYRPYDRRTAACWRTVPCSASSASASRNASSMPARRRPAARASATPTRRAPRSFGSSSGERKAAERELLGAGSVARGDRARRLQPPDRREVVAGRAWAEQSLGLVEVLERPGEVVAGRDRRVGARHVSAREMNRVLGRLEQRDRAPEVVERRERLRLLERQPPERPVQPHLRVPVGAVAVAREQLGDDRLRALRARRGRSARSSGRCCTGFARVHVLGLDSGDLVERALEQRHRLARGARRRVGERPSVENTSGRDAGVTSSDPVDRRQLPTAPAWSPRPAASSPSAIRARVAAARSAPASASASISSTASASASPSSRSRSSCSASRSSRSSDASSSEPVSRYSGRHAELLRQHPERLHRRRPRAGLDPGDVGVGDARRRQVPLGQPLLDPQPPEPCSDRLRTWLRRPCHEGIMPVLSRLRQLGHAI